MGDVVDAADDSTAAPLLPSPMFRNSMLPVIGLKYVTFTKRQFHLLLVDFSVGLFGHVLPFCIFLGVGGDSRLNL